MDQEASLALTFSELQCLDQDDVILLVDIDAALRVCKESTQETQIVNLLILWLRKLLRAFVKENVSCQEVFLEMKEWVQELIRAGNDLEVVFNEALDFFISIQDELAHSSELQMHAASNFLLALILGVLDKERAIQQEENVSLAIKLHINVLTLLQGITSHSREPPSIHLLPVVQQMNRVSDFLSTRIKYLEPFVKTSQTMTKLCLIYKNHISPDQSMPEWLKETILHLCDTILNHYETIYMKETLEVPLQKIEEYLRVTQKYFFMLIEIFKTEIKHQDEAVLDTLIELLMGGENKPTENLGQDINLLLAKYVRPCTLELYRKIYQLNGFQKHLIDALGDDEADNDYFELCLDFVHVAFIDDSTMTALTGQTLQKIFEYMFTDSRYFIDVNRYDSIIETFASLLYLVDYKPLKDYFFLNMFRNDLIKSQVCGDILNTWFRLRKWDGDSLAKVLNYWKLSNNSYAKCSQNVSRWQVEHLLKYFHNLMPSEDRTDQRIIEQALSIKDKALSNVDLYYELINHLELLAENQVECTKWFQQSLEVSRHWLNMEKSSTFANAYFRLALVQQLPETKLVILRGFNPQTIGFKCWYAQKFVANCQKMDDLPQLKVFSSTYPLLPELIPLLHLEKVDFKLSYDLTSYKKELSKLIYKPRQHSCYLKRRSSKGEFHVKDLIDQIYINSRHLRDLDSKFDSPDIDQLKRIIDTLRSTDPRLGNV